MAGLSDIASLRALADDGDPVAMYELGMLSLQATPPNVVAGREWMVKSAERGYSSAQRIAGIMQLRGVGISQNFVDAAAWLAKAAETGDPVSAFILGDMYEHGVGVSLDLDRARCFMEIAAEAGLAGAQATLAGYWHDGVGGEIDTDKALMWVLRAARQGMQRAQVAAGELLARSAGKGDPADAVMWVTLAHAGPEEPYSGIAGKLLAELTRIFPETVVLNGVKAASQFVAVTEYVMPDELLGLDQGGYAA